MTWIEGLIIVLDFGGQYNQLIAGRVRECGVYADVHPYTLPPERIREMNPKGIIFTGARIVYMIWNRRISRKKSAAAAETGKWDPLSGIPSCVSGKKSEAEGFCARFQAALIPL